VNAKLVRKIGASEGKIYYQCQRQSRYASSFALFLAADRFLRTFAISVQPMLWGNVIQARSGESLTPTPSKTVVL